MSVVETSHELAATGSGLSLVSASSTYGAGKLVLVAVFGNSASPSEPTISGLSATWTEADWGTFGGGAYAVGLWWAYLTSAQTGAITATFDESQTGSEMVVSVGHHAHPTSPIRQAAIATGTGSSLLVGLSAFTGDRSSTFGVGATATVRDFTAGTNFTELYDGNRMATEKQLGQDSTVDMGCGASAAWALIGVEIEGSNEVAHYYVEGNTAQTTQSSSYTAVDTINGNIAGGDLSPNTKYLIIARAIFGVDDTTDKGYLHVYTADSADIISKSETLVEFQQTGATELKSYFFAHSFTTDASPSWVRFEFKVEGAATITCDQYSLFLIDLDDLGSDNYVEDINAATGTEIGLWDGVTVLAEIAAADLGITEEWLTLGCAKIGVGSTGVNYNVTFYAADDGTPASAINVVDEEGEDTAEERMVGVVGRHKAITTATPSQIIAWEDAGNGNMTDEGSYLIALKASAFADFEHDYGYTTSTLITGEITVASVGPYTPTTNGNHLIIGRVMKDAVASQFMYLHLEDGVTETRTGDSTPTHNQNWDGAKDKEPGFTMERIFISGEKTYNLRATPSGQHNVQDSWLLVLNLNKASTSGPQYITPALKQDLLTAYDPTNLARGVVNIDPALYQSLATSYDPTDLVQTFPDQFLDPAIHQQIATAYDPTNLVRGVVYIDPALFQQLATAHDPTIKLFLITALYQQLVQSYDPSLVAGSVYIDPSLHQQLVAAHDPTLVAGPVYLNPELFQQLTVAYDPTNLDRGPVYIDPALYQKLMVQYDPVVVGAQEFTVELMQSLATAYDPTLTWEEFITPDLVQELITAFSPTLNRFVSTALVQQLTASYDPQINLNVHPAIHQQLMASYDPTTMQVSIHPALHQQLATAYDPVLVTNYYITLALYQQLAAAHDPWVKGDQLVETALYQQLATVYDLVVSMGIAPTLVQSLLTAYDPTLTYTYDIDPSLMQSLAAAFDPSLSPGEVVISPALVDASAAAYDPTIVTSYSVVVDLVNQTAVVYDPVLDQTIPDQFVEPVLEQQLIAVYDPVVQGATAYIVLTTVSNLAQVFGVTIEGGEDDGKMLTMQDRSQ